MINPVGYGLHHPMGIEPDRPSTLEEQQLMARSGNAAQTNRPPMPEVVNMLLHSGDLAKSRRPPNSREGQLARARHLAISNRMAALEEKLTRASASASEVNVRRPLAPIRPQANQQRASTALDSSQSRKSNPSRKSKHSVTNSSGRPQGVRYSDKEATYIAAQLQSTSDMESSFSQAIHKVAPPSTRLQRKRVGSLGDQIASVAAQLDSQSDLDSSTGQASREFAPTSTRPPRKRLASSGLEPEHGKRMKETISVLISNLRPQRSSRSTQAALLRRASSRLKPKAAAITTGTTGSPKQLLSNAISSLTNVVEIADGKRADKQPLTQSAIVDAMRNNDWKKVDTMLYEPGSPLRSLPLGAKNIVLLADKFPGAATAPWFQQALTLARGPEWSSDKPKECDTAFNPGEKIRRFIQAQKDGQNVTPDGLIDAVNDGMTKARELLKTLTLNRDAEFPN